MSLYLLRQNAVTCFSHGLSNMGGVRRHLLGSRTRVRAACKLWYTNDGDGLDAERSIRLADVLKRDSSMALREAYWRQAACTSSPPDEVCRNCGGAGVRTDAVGIKLGFR